MSPDRDSYAFPPHGAHIAQVVLVECERGAGDARRSVLQVWSADGVLLAEHDRVHPDPIYPAYFLREKADAQMLAGWAALAAAWPHPEGRPVLDYGVALAGQAPAAINSEALQQAQGEG